MSSGSVLSRENAWRIFSITVIFVLTSAKIEPDVRTLFGWILYRSVESAEFTGLEKIDNAVRTNAFFLIVASDRFSLGEPIGGLGKNLDDFIGIER